jgi:hypothetical protein
MIYIYGSLNSEFVQAITHNTTYTNAITNELINKNAGPFLDVRLRYLAGTDKIESVNSAYNILHTTDENLLANDGYHIITNWHNPLYERYIKNANPKNKYYIVDTVNFEPYNVIDNIVCKDDPRITMFTSIQEDNSNRIFDIGLNIRVFTYRHISMEHLFGFDIFKKHIKNNRLDLTIRNFIFKEERMDMFSRLVKLNKDNIFLRVNAYYINIVNAVKKIYKEANQLDIKHTILDEIKFVSELNDKHIGNEIFSQGAVVAHIGGLKFINCTLQSDITILFESNMNWMYVSEPEKWNNFTEKLVDNFMVGKPFISCSKFIIDWCRKNGFEDYGEIFGIDYDSIFKHYTGNRGDNSYLIVNELLQIEIEKISNMPENEYKILLDKVMEAAERNRLKFFECFENNTIFDNIINDYNLNFKNTI